MDDQDTGLTVAFELERYRHFISHLGLPSEREAEMISVLHAYLGGHVDRAFGHDPIQLAAGDRLQLSGDRSIRPVIASEPSTIPHHDDLSGTFTDVSGPGQGKR